MNILDKIVAWFSPKAGVERAQMREILNEKARRYEAASYSRRTRDWFAPSDGPNVNIIYAIVTLRNRSRDLARNNPYAKKAIEAICGNVVGTGIQANPMAKGGAYDRAKKSWRTWAEDAENVDWDGDQNIYAMQELIMRTVAESGECLIVRRRSGDSIPLQLQVLEGDYIDHNKHNITSERGGTIILGVEFDQQGKKIGYWLYDKNPNDTVTSVPTSRFVPREEVIHVFEKLRPGQIRGVPWGVTAFLRMRDLDQYEDAQLVRQKIAACFSVFITDTSHHNSLAAKAGKSVQLEKVEPGIIEYLTPGKEVSFATPPAAEGYEPYVRQMLRSIAIAYGVSYEILTSDLSKVNFSSARMGWLEFQRNVTKWQWFLMVPAMNRIWKWFSGVAVATGQIGRPVLADWTTPRREMIDPFKETEALRIQIQSGLKSWQEALRELGYDPADVANELAQDYATFDELGLKLLTDYRTQIEMKKPAPRASESGGSQQNSGE
jgi:lambda family phage portal protein